MDDLLMLLLSVPDLQSLVSDMRRMGWNVENTPRGYVCHQNTRFGKALVLYAMRVNNEYRVKINPAFFDTGAAQSKAVH